VREEEKMLKQGLWRYMGFYALDLGLEPGTAFFQPHITRSTPPLL